MLMVNELEIVKMFQYESVLHHDNIRNRTWNSEEFLSSVEHRRTSDHKISEVKSMSIDLTTKAVLYVSMGELQQ
jgi:hypothetical protein